MLIEWFLGSTADMSLILSDEYPDFEALTIIILANDYIYSLDTIHPACCDDNIWHCLLMCQGATEIRIFLS